MEQQVRKLFNFHFVCVVVSKTKRITSGIPSSFPKEKMGNVLALDTTPDTVEDAKYLSITDDVIVSDTFVDSILNDMSHFEISKDPTLSREEKQTFSTVDIPHKVTRLVQLFSQPHEHHNHTSEQSHVSEVCRYQLYRISEHLLAHVFFPLFSRIYPSIMWTSKVPPLPFHLKSEAGCCRECICLTFAKCKPSTSTPSTPRKAPQLRETIFPKKNPKNHFFWRHHFKCRWI